MTGIDQAAFWAIYAFSGSALVPNWVVVFFAKYLVYALIAVFIIRLFMGLSWRERFFYFSLSLLGAITARGILTSIIGELFRVPRPFQALGMDPLFAVSDVTSFPSGHMAFIVPLAMTLWLIDKRWSAWLFAGTVFVGIARIMAGVHWLLDIVFGVLVGAVGFGAAYFVLRKSAPARSAGKIKESTRTIKKNVTAGT